MALNYGTSTALACTSLNSLASSTTTGAASTSSATTSTTANVTDALVRVKVTPGAIAPSASTFVAVYAYGSEDGSNWPGAAATNEVLSGSDAAVVLSTYGNNLRFLGTIMCHTANQATQSEPMSVASAFGGTLPRKWALVIQNQTGVALAAAGHEVKYSEVYYN